MFMAKHKHNILKQHTESKSTGGFSVLYMALVFVPEDKMKQG